MSEEAMQLQCECENPERRSYHYRRDPEGVWRCEQCDGIMAAGERADAIPEAAIEAAAQALCAWPSVKVDDREHNTATHMAADALLAALPFLRAAHPEAGSERPKLIVDWTEDGQGIVLDTRTDPATVVGTHDWEEPEAGSENAERLLSVIGSTSCNCRSKAEDALRAAHPEAGSEESERLRMQRDVARRNFRMLDERAAQLLDAVKTAVQELPLTRVDSKPSDFQDGPSRAGARLRLALRAAHPEANRAPTQRERDRALSDYMAEHGPNAQRRRRNAARREADRAPETRAGQEEQWDQGSSGVGEADRAPAAGFRGTNPQRHPWFATGDVQMGPLPPGCRVAQSSGMQEEEVPLYRRRAQEARAAHEADRAPETDEQTDEASSPHGVSVDRAPSEVETVARDLRALGDEWRADWSDFDGRAAKRELYELADRLDAVRGQARDDTVCRAFSSDPHEVCMTYEQWERMFGRSRDGTVKHVAGALNAAIENASTREHFVRRIKMLLDELDVGADQAEARDDTVTLAEALEAIADGRWNVGTDRNLSAREFARDALARFGAGRAEDE